VTPGELCSARKEGSEKIKIDTHMGSVRGCVCA
jgi:hypothetical protein